MDVILKPAQTIPASTMTLSAVEILCVNDAFQEKQIVALIKGLPKPLILWNGSAEYEAAGVWTNESATARATEILTNLSLSGTSVESYLVNARIPFPYLRNRV